MLGIEISFWLSLLSGSGACGSKPKGLMSHRPVHSRDHKSFGCLLSIWQVSTRTTWFLGMTTVKVHEWCLVCYGWLALCLRNNFHLACLFSFLFRHLLSNRNAGFCVAYLSYGILLVVQSCFRLVPLNWHWTNLEAVSLHHIFSACVDVVAR